MKKLFFSSCFLCVFLISKMNAQCDQYPFLLKSDGFVCDSGGDFCFVTDANLWFDIDDCAEFVIEFKYSTSDLVIKDPGDWSIPLISSGEGTITFAPPTLLDLLIEGCFSATLLTPGADFDLRIFHPTTEEEILNTSISLDNSVSIGTPGIPTPLSD